MRPESSRTVKLDRSGMQRELHPLWPVSLPKPFSAPARGPCPSELEDMFGFDPDVVYFGHIHRELDFDDSSRYVSPGSLGCYSKPVARFHLLEIDGDGYIISKHRVEYDDSSVFQDLEARDVPDRENIVRTFFPR